jgi:hypothetical protein
MHHLGIGTPHARKRVLALADDDLVQPEKTYWRNQNKQPGRWPTTAT